MGRKALQFATEEERRAYIRERERQWKLRTGRRRKGPADRKGENSGKHKLSLSQVQEARRLYAEGATIKELTSRFHLSYSGMWHIINNQTWVEEEKPMNQEDQRRLRHIESALRGAINTYGPITKEHLRKAAERVLARIRKKDSLCQLRRNSQ